MSVGKRYKNWAKGNRNVRILLMQEGGVACAENISYGEWNSEGM